MWGRSQHCIINFNLKTSHKRAHSFRNKQHLDGTISNTCPENQFLFCLFSKGMSEGALSPFLIHLLPLVYVTDGDLGLRHPRLTSTPSDAPANSQQKREIFFLCALTVHLSFFLSLGTYGRPQLCVDKCLCEAIEWAWLQSKFTQLTLTMLMFGSKARTWPRCQFVSAVVFGLRE